LTILSAVTIEGRGRGSFASELSATVRFVARLDPSARVRNHVGQILADGPVSFDDLLEALVSRGLELGPEPEDRLDDVLGTMARIDFLHAYDSDDDEDVDLCFDRRALVDGITWTVPITELDLASDTVPTDALGLLAIPLIHDWCTLDGGDSIDLDAPNRRREAAEALGVEGGAGVAFPAGWLADHGARAGGFLLLRLDGDVVEGRGADVAPAPSADLIDAFTGALGPESSSTACRSTGEVLAEVFVLHPELQGTVVPPLADLIEAAGLERHGSDVARAGFDFERERLRRRVEDVANEAGLRESEVQAYATLAVAWHGWATNRDEVESEALTAAADALDLVAVATAFVDDECDPDEPERLDAVVSFGEALVEAASGRHRAGPAWLVAQALGVAGRTGRFEEWIDTALAFDSEHVLALYDKAWFEFDRGEARKAKALFGRIGAGTFASDEAILDAVLAPARPAARRNDPCPCGSGRKYKHCHLGVDEVPLGARLTWLYRKANWWLERRHRAEVETMAWLRARNSVMSPRQLLEADPLIADAVLAEDGRFDEWLAERGALLPSDEAMLAAQWAMIDRSVFEVTGVRLDEGMTVRDVRTGDVVEVQERLGTHDLKVGWYLLARPLPTGTGANQFFGGITIVADSMLDRFIELLDDEPTAAQLLLLVSEAEAPPTLVNRDGDATVFCETTWTIRDAGAAAGALDAAFGPGDDDGHWTWFQDGEDDPEDPPAGGRTVLGTLELDGDRLTASTNSVERADTIGSLVESLVTGAELVEELRSDVDDIRDDLAYERAVFGEGDEPPAGLIDPADAPPELQAALRQQMDLYEEQWVDESIPALGGATPREALDDPTRRDDLFRLLDRMEEMDARRSPEQRAMGMRTSRLRELLGLPPDGGLRLPNRS
jgi:hypothetical protein